MLRTRFKITRKKLLTGALFAFVQSINSAINLLFDKLTMTRLNSKTRYSYICVRVYVYILNGSTLYTCINFYTGKLTFN